jgi:hypothetical protein
MIPRMYIGEQFMLERVRKRQGEAEHERMLSVLRKPYHGIVRYLFSFLRVFYGAPMTSMPQFEQPDQRAVCTCTRDRTPCRKDTMMNPQIHAIEQLNRATHLETVDPERERIVQCGFTPEEIVALLWLRQWYQMGGSDRVQIVRHWEFLKLLVRSGKLEV